MVDEPENRNGGLKVTGKGNEEEDPSPKSAKPSPMTSEQVMERWGIKEEKLKLFVQRFNLPAHLKQSVGLSPVVVAAFAPGGSLQLRSLYFMSDDIKKFERDHPEFLKENDQKSKIDHEQKEAKLRNNQRRRERCRALAQHQWEKHPDDNIADMARWDVIKRIGCEGRVYKHETICIWIRDLCPRPKFGRPKKDD